MCCYLRKVKSQRTSLQVKFLFRMSTNEVKDPKHEEEEEEEELNVTAQPVDDEILN